MEIVANFPGLVVTRKPFSNSYQARCHGAPVREYKHGDVIAIERQTRSHGPLWYRYKLGSVISYSMETGDDPIRAYERAKEHGHAMHWANACAVVLAANKEKDSGFAAEIGETILFEGIFFQIVNAPNSNVALKRI